MAAPFHFIPRKADAIAFLSAPSFEDQTYAMARVLDEAGFTGTVAWLTDESDPTVPRDVAEVARRPSHIALPFRSASGFFNAMRVETAFFTHGWFRGIGPRRRQTTVNLWHGMPIKAIGLLADGGAPQPASMTVATSSMFQPLLAEAFDVPPESVRLTGLPRVDLLFDDVRSTVDTALEMSGRRLLLYVPTYRAFGLTFSRTDRHDGVAGAHHFSESNWHALDRACAELEAVLVIKPHPFDAERWTAPDDVSSIRLVTSSDLRAAGVRDYHLLGSADVVISDLSSMLLDFLVLDRPIVHFFPDVDDYIRSRPTVTEEPIDSWLAGPLARNVDELVGELEAAVRTPDHQADTRHRLRERCYTDATLHPGNAKRVWDEVRARAHG